MNKYIADWIVVENTLLNEQYCLIKLSLGRELPEILPGQFVQVMINNSRDVFLRRPISVHQVDRDKHELHLLVQIVGEGTRLLSLLKPGDTVNLIYPLGTGFSLPDSKLQKLLLIGGGVGVAPLLYLGKCLKEKGFSPSFLLGAYSEENLLQLDEFKRYGSVYITTEDGSAGEKGFVTNHSILLQGDADFIYSCGPKPMMLAVARYAREFNIPCEVSLENHMACGIGACLCCVEKTVHGNVCVCTEGPVFNINQLTWQI
jgi:2-polyprenylphenol hydroxylase and related flavodoxin oxidoreductases